MSTDSCQAGNECRFCDNIVFEKLRKGLCGTCVSEMLQESEFSKSSMAKNSCQDRDDGGLTLSKSSRCNRRALAVDPKLESILYDHQKDGVRFLLKNCFADCKDETKPYGGAIVAHYSK